MGGVVPPDGRHVPGEVPPGSAVLRPCGRRRETFSAAGSRDEADGRDPERDFLAHAAGGHGGLDILNGAGGQDFAFSRGPDMEKPVKKLFLKNFISSLDKREKKCIIIC